MERYAFIWKAIQRYGYELDYRESYINSTDLKHTKVRIGCDKHGFYEQAAELHLYYFKGCKGCQYEKLHNSHSSNKEKFIQKYKEKFGCEAKYILDDIEYYNSHTYIYPICPKHGKFKIKPYKLLQGQGCSHCKSSHLENEMRKFLKENNINFEEQKQFSWLLYNGNHQSLDFYLAEYNIGIECQGNQHFKEDKGRYADISQNIKRDNNKCKLCKENKVPILYYAPFFKLENIKYNKEIYNENNFFTDLNELLDKIKALIINIS